MFGRTIENLILMATLLITITTQLNVPSMQIPYIQMAALQIPNMELGSMQMPSFEMPNILLPNLQVPKMQIPSLAHSQLPSFNLSQVLASNGLSIPHKSPLIQGGLANYGGSAGIGIGTSMANDIIGSRNIGNINEYNMGSGNSAGKGSTMEGCKMGGEHEGSRHRVSNNKGSMGGSRMGNSSPISLPYRDNLNSASYFHGGYLRRPVYTPSYYYPAQHTTYKPQILSTNQNIYPIGYPRSSYQY